VPSHDEIASVGRSVAAVPDTSTNHVAVVTVRVYDAGGVVPAALTRSLAVAYATLHVAGIDANWIACGQKVMSARCSTPIARDELAVRFVRLPGEPSAGNLSLGYSLINTPLAAGTLATIYVNRVQWLAAQAKSDAVRLLGLAVAHELGHLLLGTNAHSTSGLMRAVWSRRELQQNDPADWIFMPEERAAMEEALRQRAPQTTAHVAWSH